MDIHSHGHTIQDMFCCIPNFSGGRLTETLLLPRAYKRIIRADMQLSAMTLISKVASSAFTVSRN